MRSRMDKNTAEWAFFAGYVPVGYQQLTSLATSTALTVPASAQFALIQAEAQALRYRDDGVAPTAAIGMVLAVGDSIWYTGDLVALRIIQVAASGIANVSYYG